MGFFGDNSEENIKNLDNSGNISNNVVVDYTPQYVLTLLGIIAFIKLVELSFMAGSKIRRNQAENGSQKEFSVVKNPGFGSQEL